MDLQLVPVAQFQTFLLCLARVIALVAAIPAFAGVAASLRMKLGLGVATALVLFPLMAPHTPRVDFTLTGFGLLMVNEVLLGALIGLVAQLVFTAVSFGGTVIGYQMGFAAANIFDPQTTQQLSLMSQFINILALLAFLSLDIHHFFFRVIVESYQLLPPVPLDFSGGVSAEDNFGIGGYDRVMGPNGQAQYWAPNLAAAMGILLSHYDHTYVADGEAGPRRAETAYPSDRDVSDFPHHC